MTDRELLELAAKAAGIDVKPAGWTDSFMCRMIDQYTEDGEQCHSPWSPLTDDGDALRLAVKLNLFIDLCYPDKTCGWVGDYQSGICQTLEEPDAGDPYAATRRAIVRAAAEIGRNMK